MKKKRTKPWFQWFVGLLVVACLVIAADALLNKTSNRSLAESYERMVRELAQAFHADGEKGNPPYWRDHRLAHHPILLMNKDTHDTYLINPRETFVLFFAKKIERESEALDIYRISRLYPGLWKLKLFGGNFNTIGNVTTVMNNPVYYLKYRGADFKKPYSSQYPPIYLYHESFHYFMQTRWAGGDRFFGELSEKGMDLLHEKCQLLDEAKAILDAPEERRDECLALARKLLDLEKARLAENPAYVTAERQMETVEGTATYMGIRAARAVGYDFGTMYFDNRKNVPFSDVVPYYKDGKLSEGFLRDRLPYETGAQIALILHALDKEGRWQIYLNEQREENPRTLTDALEYTVKGQ